MTSKTKTSNTKTSKTKTSKTKTSKTKTGSTDAGRKPTNRSERIAAAAAARSSRTSSGGSPNRPAAGRSGAGGTATVRSTSAAAAVAETKEGATIKVSAAKLRAGNVTRVTTAIAKRSPLGRFGLFNGLGSARLPGSRMRSGGGDRVGGVAPFVPPKSRLGRRKRMREWSRVGFVQLSPGKQKLRHRILPRTVIGIASMLMAGGIGAAFSGAAFYAYYDNRLAENERTVARFVEGFDQQFTDAAGALDEMRTDAVSNIRAELQPLEGYVSQAQGVVGLPATAGQSVWLIETRDENGAISQGSAFAIVGHEGGTALVTSHAAVLSSTTIPGPGIELIKNGERVPATLWAWDQANDLALVVVDRQIPVLEMADQSTQVRAVGTAVFAMSGFGGQGATAAPGVLLDHSRVGLQHTAPVGSLFVGGPLLTADGKVLGVASKQYRPLGLDQGAVPQAPDVAAICRTILRCSETEQTLTAEVADN